jgi:hypothetical protein
MPSWWNNYFELILVNLVRILRLMLVIISFPTTSFTVDGSFENIGIAFRVFFIFLFYGFVMLVIAYPSGVFFFFSYTRNVLMNGDNWKIRKLSNISVLFPNFNLLFN